MKKHSLVLRKKKYKKKNPIITISLYITLTSLICAFLFIYYFANKLGPNLIKCAEDEINSLTSNLMGNCIAKYLKETEELNLVTILEDEQDIKRIQYNTKILNDTRTKILDILDENLSHITKGDFEKSIIDFSKISKENYEKTSSGIVFTVSTGSALGNPFFSNLGPKIPLNLSTVVDTNADITTNITEYGLNNALLEISIVLNAALVIHMPFLSKEVTVVNKIPISIELIQGIVPNNYLNYAT